MTIILRTPAAVKNNQLPTNFYLPGFTNYEAYENLLKLCLKSGDALAFMKGLNAFLTNIYSKENF